MVKHIVIEVTGRVQGVSFRQSIKEEARKLGLSGTVRNMPGGAVEIHAEGEEDSLDALIKWCQDGPQLASVDKVNRRALPTKGYRDFRVIL